MPDQIFTTTTTNPNIEVPQVEKLKPVWKKPSRKWRIVGRVIAGLFAFGLINLTVVLLEPYFLYLCSFQLTYTTEKITLYQDGPRPDVLLMGSSRVENGLDPTVVEQTIADKTGVKPRILNLGMPSGSLKSNYLILKNIIQDDKKPSVIVYGLAELELADDTSDQEVYQHLTDKLPYSGVLFRPDDLGRFGGTNPAEQAGFLFNQLIPLFRDQRLILQALNIQFNPQDVYHANYASDKKITANGFFKLDNPLSPADLEASGASYKKDLADYHPNKASINIFQDFLKLAKDRGIKVVLVNMPVTSQHLSFWQNKDQLKDYLDLVRTVARENNVPLLDSYQDIDQNLSAADFYDTNHLTTSGAYTLSKMLGETILAGYFQPDNPTSPDLYRASITGLNILPRLPANFSYAGKISFTNQSQHFWSVYGKQAVRISYHWLKPDGSMYEFEGFRTYLEYSPAPGQPQTVNFTLITPKVAGNYILEMDLMYEYISWFNTRGSPTLRQPVIIEN